MPDNPIPLCWIVNPWQLLLLLQNALTLTVSSMPKLPLHCMYAMIFYAVRISTGKKRQGNWFSKSVSIDQVDQPVVLQCKLVFRTCVIRQLGRRDYFNAATITSTIAAVALTRQTLTTLDSFLFSFFHKRNIGRFLLIYTKLSRDMSKRHQEAHANAVPKV